MVTYEDSGGPGGSIAIKGDHVRPKSVLRVATICWLVAPSCPFAVVITQTHAPSSAFTM